VRFPAGFNIALSIELAELIHHAYQQFESFQNERPWKLPAKYSLLTEFSYLWTPGRRIEKGIRNFDVTLRRLSRSTSEKNTKIPIGFVARRKDRVFLVLRGTQTVKEWIRNFSIGLSAFTIPSFGKVHDGFLQTYSAIRGEILESLARADSKARIYITGHSLGAALTTFALPDIEASLKRKVSALYTYGSPRVGDNEFVRAFNGAFGRISFRVANTSDIITSIPLPAPIAGIVGGYFSHVDTPVDLTIQKNDLEENHDIRTYISALRDIETQKGFFEKLLTKSI
jgi:triacylglycerol lipase